MEEHAHGAGNSAQPAAPRVGTLHAIPPTMVRLIDLQNYITVEPHHNSRGQENGLHREVAIMRGGVGVI